MSAIVVFVSAESSGWNDDGICAMKQVFEKAEMLLEKEAASYGCELDIVSEYHFAHTENALYIGDSQAWAENAIHSVSALSEYDSPAYRNTPVFFF